MNPRAPSLVFRLLRQAVRRGLLRRGYGRLLRNIPPGVWGGHDLLVQTQAGPMCLPVSEPSSTGLLLWGYLPHEVRETALVRALGNDVQTVFDVGAHSGWYARVMATSNGSRSVFAFEADPRTATYLRWNVGGLPAATCEAVAVSDRSGRVSFYRADNANLSSSVRPVGEPIGVEATSLDDFCEQHKIERVDFVKCDVEGGELAVLRGARRLRETAAPPIWMIEVDEGFLREAGLSVDEMMREISRTPGIKIFTQDDRGRPVEIGSVGERIGGSNVFLVPEQRLTVFRAAADAMTLTR